MKGYFNHIVNRNRAQARESHRLLPVPSRNPFALRERMVNPIQESPESMGLPQLMDPATRTPQVQESSRESRVVKPSSPTAPVFWPLTPAAVEKETSVPDEEVRIPPITGKEKKSLEPQKPEESVFSEKHKTILENPEEKKTTHFPLRESMVSEPVKPQEELLPVKKERVFSFRYQVEKTGPQQDLTERLKEPQQMEKPDAKGKKEGERKAVLPQTKPEPQPESPAQVKRRSLLPPQQSALPMPRSQQKREQAQPKLVIGKLTVEVVQTPSPAVQAVSRPPRQKAVAPASPATQRPRYKLKFGLGQL